MNISKGKLVLIIILFLFVYFNLFKSKNNNTSNETVNENCYMSHTQEPTIGETVKNINPHCKHYNSKGIVLGISELPNNMGKIITYRVTNYGNTFKSGDQLSKTMDQLNKCLNDG